jgi:hypothetical protein
MTQKIKAIILILIILIATLLVVLYVYNKKNTTNTTNIKRVELINAAVPSMVPVEKDDASKKIELVMEKAIIEGVVNLIGEKQLQIKVANGDIGSVNISAQTPIHNEGDAKLENLSILKLNTAVVIKLDENNNALDILIKK